MGPMAWLMVGVAVFVLGVCWACLIVGSDADDAIDEVWPR